MLFLWCGDATLTRLAKIAIGLLVGYVIFMAYSTAYAETFEYQGSFPIPDNVKEMQTMCSIEMYGTNIYEYTCNWRFMAEDVPEWVDKLVTKHGLINPPAEQIFEEAKTELEIFNETVPEMARYESDLERFLDKEPQRPGDKEYFELLKELATCQRGTGAAKGIQSEERFAVSTTWVNPTEPYLTSYELTGSYGNLKKAIQECRAQHTILEPIVLGPEAYNKGLFADSIQPYHADMAVTTKWNTIPTHQSITEHDLESEKKSAYIKMCQSEFVNTSFKIQQGCMIDLTVGFNLDGTCRDTTIVNQDSTGCIPAESEPFVYPSDSGNQGELVKDYSQFSPMEKYTLNKYDNGENMFTELQQQKIRDLQKAANP